MFINLAATTRRVIGIFVVNIAQKPGEKICFYVEKHEHISVSLFSLTRIRIKYQFKISYDRLTNRQKE